ncbi:Ppx/GppA family phosphatase [bacterium]|nr:Ppx/GppA family phosphatase [bacterium]
MPYTFAAVDAGSNAIRLTVARAESPGEIVALEKERVPVRLGHHVFTRRKFDRETVDAAVDAFRYFRQIFDRLHVQEYRAVATSAARNARNRKSVIQRIQEEADIRLEVIDGPEEARLVRAAALGAVNDKLTPALILDIGGGSLELNLMTGRRLDRGLTLPLGTVRMMEMFDAGDAVSKQSEEAIRHFALEKFESELADPPRLAGRPALACGGNAEALAPIAPGKPVQGHPVLDLSRLERILPDMLRMTVKERMKAYDIRAERAEVMPMAAIVLCALSRYLGCDTLIVPGVGVRDGILRDLVESRFGVHGAGATEDDLVAAARDFAMAHGADDDHIEHVRRIAVSIFENTRALHGLTDQDRLPLVLASLLHDIGHSINFVDHHKHGEYLVRHGAIRGLTNDMREIVAALVLYHRRIDPRPEDELYSRFSGALKKKVRLLAAILRIADGLDTDHRQAVTEVEVSDNGKALLLTAVCRGSPKLPLWGAGRKSRLLEKELDRKLTIASRAA